MMQLPNITDADNEGKDTSYNSEAYLYISWSTLLSCLQKDGYSMTQLPHSAQLFKLICEENSLSLLLTSRLNDQIDSFSSKLFTKLWKMELDERIKFCTGLTQDKGPSWACKVLPDEFTHEEEYRRVCLDNEIRGLHSRWMEFQNESDFEEPFGAGPLRGMF